MLSQLKFSKGEVPFFQCAPLIFQGGHFESDIERYARYPGTGLNLSQILERLMFNFLSALLVQFSH